MCPEEQGWSKAYADDFLKGCKAKAVRVWEKGSEAKE